MTSAVEQQEKEEMASFGSDNNINPSDYSCQILQEKTTLDAANDKSLPNDARLVWYVVDGVEYIDLTRCRKTVELFDMYYDKFKDKLKSIDYGHGNIKPALWGYRSPQQKKKRK